MDEIPQWEYHLEDGPVYTGSLGISESRLNELGQLGWELVTCGWYDDKGVLLCRAVFKRPKYDEG